MKNKIIKYGALICVILAVFAATCIPTFAAEGDTITLKAGTYVFNTVIDNIDGLPTNTNIPFVIDLMDGDTYRNTVNTVKFLNSKSGVSGIFIYFSDYLMYSTHTIGGFVGWYTHYQGMPWNSVRLSTDQNVDVALGNWFISNTNYNEVNGASHVTTITEVWTSILEWLMSSLNTVQGLFFSNGELTLLGTLCTIGLAVSIVFLAIGLIQRFLHLRS